MLKEKYTRKTITLLNVFQSFNFPKFTPKVPNPLQEDVKITITYLKRLNTFQLLSLHLLPGMESVPVRSRISERNTHNEVLVEPN